MHIIKVDKCSDQNLFLGTGKITHDHLKSEFIHVVNTIIYWDGTLTLFVQVVFPIHIDTISKGLSILHFKESKVEVSKSRCISVPEDCFNLSKQCRS